MGGLVFGMHTMVVNPPRAAAIVPVAIRGSHAVMPRGAALIRAGTVSIEVGEPIPTAGLTAADRDALIARVRGEIARMLGETDAQTAAAQ